jgi:hypothetical protein
MGFIVYHLAERHPSVQELLEPNRGSRPTLGEGERGESRSASEIPRYLAFARAIQFFRLLASVAGAFHA